jgi:glutamyl-tRNA reductase
VDLGMPRNIEPGVADLYNVYLYDMEHLSEIVEQNKKARQDEVPHAETIVEEQVEKFRKWQSGVEASAVVSALRARLAGEREAFLRERLASWPQLSAEDRTRMSALMDDLLNRVLLDPAESLKGEPDLRRKLQNLEALRDLFRLDRDDTSSTDKPGRAGKS